MANLLGQDIIAKNIIVKAQEGVHLATDVYRSVSGKQIPALAQPVEITPKAPLT